MPDCPLSVCFRIRTVAAALAALALAFLGQESANAAAAVETLAIARTPVKHEVKLATYLGGRSTDQATGVAVDGDGNIYVCGTATSKVFPSFLTDAPKPGGKSDAFILKLDPAGEKTLGCIRFGGSGETQGGRVRVSRNGTVYLMGTSSSEDFPGTISRFPRDAGKASQPVLFVASFDRDLKLLNAARFGTRAAYPGGLAIDARGNVQVSATSFDPDFPTTPTGFEPKCNGQNFAVYFVLNPALDKMLYGTALNSYSTWVASSYVNDMVVGPDGSATLAGIADPPIRVTHNALFKGTNATAPFVARINPYAAGAASMLLATFLELPLAKANSVALDARGVLYLTGTTEPGPKDLLHQVKPV